MTPLGLDFVLLTSSNSVREGLENMLTAAIGDHGYNLSYVDASISLLVIEAAKRAEDREEWFPRGKSATIQSMQAATESQLARMFKSVETP